MNLQGLLDIAKDKVRARFEDERLSVKLLSRLAFLSTLAAIVMMVAPTAAEEATPISTIQPTTAVETSTAEVSTETSTVSIESDTQTLVINNLPLSSETKIAEETPTVKVVVDTVTALAIQPKFQFKLPSNLLVDPRAQAKFLPNSSVAGSEYVLACITGNGINSDVLQKRVGSDQNSNGIVVVGDLSANLYLSASADNLNATLNSANGLLAFSNGRSIANRSLSFRFIAVNKPGVDPKLCNQAKSAFTVNFLPMGLDLGIVKTEIKLK